MVSCLTVRVVIIYHNIYYNQEFCAHCIVIMNDGGWVGGGRGVLIHIRVWLGGQGVGYLIVFFIFAFVFRSLMSYLFFKLVEHDSCCVCFFFYYLFSLSLVPLTRSYWGIEIVASVM